MPILKQIAIASYAKRNRRDLSSTGTGESFGSGLSADRLALLDRAFQLRPVRRGVRGMTYDLKIVGGSIVDGTGGSDFAAISA